MLREYLGIPGKASFANRHSSVKDALLRPDLTAVRDDRPPSSDCSEWASWLPDRLHGSLGSAPDRAVDTHLLTCDACLARFIACVLGACSPSQQPVPA